MIDHDKLRGLLNADSNETLFRTYRGWIESQLKAKPERQEHFGRSLAVGSEAFIRRVQRSLGIRAVGRRTIKTPATGYQLKESIVAYGIIDSDRTANNPAIADTNAISWNLENFLE